MNDRDIDDIDELELEDYEDKMLTDPEQRRGKAEYDRDEIREADFHEEEYEEKEEDPEDIVDDMLGDI